MDGKDGRQPPPDLEAGDWRTNLNPESRQRILTKIVDTLKKHLLVSTPEGLSELQKIAVRFEEKIYTAATSQSDYLRKISLKMLSIETKHKAPNNPSMSNSGPNQNPTNSGSTNMPSGVSSIPGSGQSTLSGVGLLGTGQNSSTSSLVRAAASDMYVNSQSQMQGRQLQIATQQLQQYQNQLIQLQLQRQLLNQKMQQQQQELQQQQQQQQNMLQATQLQSSQQDMLASVDSTGQTGNVGISDWQEEVYQKVKTMKELYFNELDELYQKIALKMQQADNLIPPVKLSEQYEKIKKYMPLLERLLNILQLPKASIQITLKDKLPLYEKQMVHMLASHKKKPMPTTAQQQLQLSASHAQSLLQQQPSQTSQLQQQDNHKYQGQQKNMHGSATSMQSAAAPGVHGSMPLSSQFGITSSQQNVTNGLQPSPTTDAVHGNSLTTIQQGSIGGIQGAVVSIPQQTNSNTLMHSSANTLQSGVTSMRPNSNTLQQLQQQQQQQLMLIQLMQQLNFQQQMLQLQKHQVLQTQYLPQQHFQQEAAQVPVHSQLHQTNEANSVKLRQGSGIKPGLHHQHNAGGQCRNYYQKLISGVPFPILPLQNLQTLSPQISHESSTQINQHSLFSSQVKVGTPLAYANSLFTPSPSKNLAPSPIPGEMDKPLSVVSLNLNSGLGGHQQTGLAPTQLQLLPVPIQGMSASPLLAEFTSPDVNQANLNSAAAGKTSVADSPNEHLTKAKEIAESPGVAIKETSKKLPNIEMQNDGFIKLSQLNEKCEKWKMEKENLQKKMNKQTLIFCWILQAIFIVCFFLLK